MNLHDLPLQAPAASVEAEQSVLGALILSNDAIDKITDLRTEHFYRSEHRAIYAEIQRQITAGKTCDVISLFDALKDAVDECLPYLNSLAMNTPSAANIRRHAETVIDRALKRSLVSIGGEMADVAASSKEDAYTLANRFAAHLDGIVEKKVSSAPTKFMDGLTAHMDLLDARMTGRIKPISTGFADLDSRLDGGVERGTLTVVAGRPAMGKTAFGLAVARNAAIAGGAGFLSMEMPKAQINDRLLASIGKLPLKWLKCPVEADQDNWSRLTHAVSAAQELNLYLDDETALNMLEIRTKARQIKRHTKTLDVLVIDQLSFITGSDAENKAYELGEYTRGCKAIAKELDCAVVLLAQLNRECEKRQNKRPMASDLSSSGSIEQDADNIIFLYRDEVYYPETTDKGVCEVITAKQRQGEPGVVPLVYIGNQTRFEDFGRPWVPANVRETRKVVRGFE